MPSSIARLQQLKVGVLGGGQLGRMMAQAASRLGVSLTVLDPTGLASPAGQVSGRAVTGSFSDAAAITTLASQVDVLTVEIEHVDADALQAVADAGHVVVHPAPATLKLIQDKLLQKQHLGTVANVALGDFLPIGDLAALLAAGEAWGYPLMLKARKGAYDGRGNAVVSSAQAAAAALASLGGGQSVQLYAERWCPFVRELALMVARSANGQVVAYPVVETVQRENQCHAVIAPARISSTVSAKASAVAEAAIRSLEGAGIFGVELFEMEDGTVLLNEIAPRPHNSGHYTMDGCYTEQHEQHLRAVLGMPLGDASLKVAGCAMLNVIGAADGSLETTLAPASRAMATPRCALHWYGKSPPKAKRKMGHINVCADSAEAAAQIVARLDDPSLGAPLAPTGATIAPLIGIIMGSDSDLPCMRAAAEILEAFNVPFELTIVSAHRTPQRLYDYSRTAASRGLHAIIAGAGGAAHLPGMVAAITPLPVIGVPVKSSALSGNDSLLSIVQMPKGIPVATVAIHNAANAALLAVRMLGIGNATMRAQMEDFMLRQEKEVLDKADKLEKVGFRDY